MMSPRPYVIAAFLLSCIAWGCASSPHREISAARAALVQARDAQADRFAPVDYQKAGALLLEAQKLINNKNYELAKKLILQAKQLADTATTIAYENKVLGELRELRNRELEKTTVPAQKPEMQKSTIEPSQKAARTKEKETPLPPTPATISYTVGNDESLWSISARREIYDDPLLWPLLYKANRDQISDPRTVYPGQVLSIPRNASNQELQEAREQAQKSDIFPVDLLK